MKKIQSKMKALEWSKVYLEFFKRSMAANSVVSDGILTKFKIIQAFMVVLVTAKYVDDSSKNEGSRVVTTFFHFTSMGIFPGTQAALTPQLEVWSRIITNPSKILWLSLLAARMIKIQSKLKVLEWSQV